MGPLLRYISATIYLSNLSFFSRWQPAAILDLWDKFWDDAQREFCGLYPFAKFDRNRISSFHNTSLNILRVWPENAYSRPMLAVLGVKQEKMETFCIVIPLGMQ